MGLLNMEVFGLQRPCLATYNLIYEYVLIYLPIFVLQILKNMNRRSCLPPPIV